PVAGIRAHWAVRPRRLSRPGRRVGAASLAGASLWLFALAGAGNRVGPESGPQTGDRSLLVAGTRRIRSPRARAILSPCAARILGVTGPAGRHGAVLPSGPATLGRSARPVHAHLVLPRFLVLAVTPPELALPTSAQPTTARLTTVGLMPRGRL